MILEDARIGERAFSSPLSDLEIDVFFTLIPKVFGADSFRIMGLPLVAPV
jgi:hypothetical protein